MTGSTSTTGRSAAAETAERTVRQSQLTLTRSVRWLGFWAAIALPAVYLPVLYAGIENTGAVVLALLGLQLLALRAGHNYNNDI